MTELKIMGFALGAIVVAIILFAIIGAIRKATLKKKNTAKLAEIMLKKDLSSKCSRCTFYMNNDYNNGYSQSEWLKIFKESVIDKEWDKDSEEYAKAVAPYINAIVVDDTGYYLRRGMENMANALKKFQPGVNDRVSLNYFVEPYEYVEDEERATKYAQAKAQYEEETKDLREAQDRYQWALRRYNEHKGTKSESFYEAKMNEAKAAMLSAQIRYDNRK